MILSNRIRALCQFTIIIITLVLFTPYAEALTIGLGPATVKINVESDWNDWQWNIKLEWNGGAHDNDITSFHISGLEGDVTDTWEYEDFQATDGWSNPPAKTKATGAFDWTSGAGWNSPLSATNLVVDLSFDSDYNWDPKRFYTISVDDSSGKWFTSTIPEPATMLLLGFGLLCLAGVSRKKDTN